MCDGHSWSADPTSICNEGPPPSPVFGVTVMGSHMTILGNEMQENLLDEASNKIPRVSYHPLCCSSCLDPSLSPGSAEPTKLKSTNEEGGARKS